jgi:8-oxo-dGTP pyrophosphatase MutT (NUDIX family)
MPQAVAIVLVRAGNRWLVVRRPDGVHEWSIPGGHVERGETPARAGIREVAEETGIQARSLIPLGVDQTSGRPVHVFLATAWRGQARPLEGWPVAWIPWRQLRAQAVCFGGSLDRIAGALRSRGGNVG